MDHKRAVAGGTEAYMSALTSAVVLDEILRISSVFKPPKMPRSESFKSDSLGDFTKKITDPRNAQRRSKWSGIAQEVPEILAKYRLKAAEIRKKGKDPSLEMDKKDIQRWAILDQMEKILLQRDKETNRINSIRNNTWTASDVQAVLRIDRPEPSDLGSSSDDTSPTKLGIPFLRMLRERLHESESSVDVFDNIDDARAFSSLESNLASPINEKYLERLRSETDLPIMDSERADLANEFGESFTDVEIQIELDAEKEIAKGVGSGVKVPDIRAEKIASRMVRGARGSLKNIFNRKSTPEQREKALESADKLQWGYLEDALVATFGGTSANDASSRGAKSKLTLPKQGAARGRLRSRKKARKHRTILEALQDYARINNISSLAGLALGAVPHSVIRLLNPKVDSRDIKATGLKESQYQQTGELLKTTPRGPLSIFFRDWQIMGGSHLDAVKKMIIYIQDNVKNEDGSLRFTGPDAFKEATMWAKMGGDNKSDKGLIDLWTRIHREGIAEHGPDGFMQIMAEHSNVALNRYNLFDNNDEVDFRKELKDAFLEGITHHGLNERTFLNLNNEDIALFANIVTTLDENPPLANYLKRVLGIKEDATFKLGDKEVSFGTIVAYQFSRPEAKDNLWFQPIWEETRVIKDGKVSYEKTNVTWGDVINGMYVTDQVVQKGALSVWTELELLNMMNSSGNRQVIQKILLANTFGVDIDIDLTNSQRLDSNRDKFANNRIKHHGFLNKPKTDEASEDLVLESGGFNGYDPNGHGRVVWSSLGKTIENLQDWDVADPRMRPTLAAYGIARLLLGAGLIRYHNGKLVSSAYVSKAIDKLKDGQKISNDSIRFAANLIRKAEGKLWIESKRAKEAQAQIKDTKEFLDITISSVDTIPPFLPTDQRVNEFVFTDYDTAQRNLPVDQNGKILQNVVLKYIAKDKKYLYVYKKGQEASLVGGKVRKERVITPSDSSTGTLWDTSNNDSTDTEFTDDTPMSVEEEAKDQGGGEYVEDADADDDALSQAQFNANQFNADPNQIIDVLSSQLDPHDMPLIEGLDNDADFTLGLNYIRFLKRERDTGVGPIEFANMARLFTELTGIRDGKSRDSVLNKDDDAPFLSSSEAIALLEWGIVDDTLRKALFGGGRIDVKSDGELSIDLSFTSDRVETILRGLKEVRRAAKENIPAASYFILHEQVERMLTIANQGEYDPRLVTPPTDKNPNPDFDQDLYNKVREQKTDTERLKVIFVREFIDPRSRAAFFNSLEALGFSKEKLKGFRDAVANLANYDTNKAAYDAVSREVGEKITEPKDLLTGDAATVFKKLRIFASKGLEYDARKQWGPNSLASANVVHEGIAHYLTMALFKYRSLAKESGLDKIKTDQDLKENILMKIKEPLGRIAKDILASVVNMRNRVLAIGPWRTYLEDGKQKHRASTYVGKRDEEGGLIEPAVGALPPKDRSNPFTSHSEAASGLLVQVGEEGKNFLDEDTAFGEAWHYIDRLQQRALDVMDGVKEIDENESSGKTHFYREGEYTRKLTGDFEPTSKVEEQLAEIERELATRDRDDDFLKLLVERDKLRNELNSRENIEVSKERLHILLEESLTDQQRRDAGAGHVVHGRINNLPPDKREDLVRNLTIDILNRIDVGRTGGLDEPGTGKFSRFMGGLARAGTYLATVISATHGGQYHVRASRFFAIRAIGTLAEPKGVNTEGALSGYIPAAFTQDDINKDLNVTRKFLNDYTQFLYSIKSETKKKEIGEAVLYAIESQALTDEERVEIFNRHNISEKAIAGLLMYRERMLGEGGIIHKFIIAAEGPGTISPQQAKSLLQKPRLPFAVKRSYLDNEDNFAKTIESVRKDFLGTQLSNLRGGKDRLRIDIALLEDLGILWHANKDAREKSYEIDHTGKLEGQQWTPEYKNLFLSLGEYLPSLDFHRHTLDRMTELEKVEVIMDGIKDLLLTGHSRTEGEDSSPIENFFSSPPGDTFLNLIINLVENNEALNWSKSRNNQGLVEEGVSVTPATQKARIREKARAQRNNQSPRPIKEIGIGGDKALQMVERWQSGGSLVSSMIHYTEPRLRTAEWKNSPDNEFMAAEVTDLSALNASLFGGKVAEDLHTYVNSNVFGVTDLSIPRIIDTLRKAVENNEFIPAGDGKMVRLDSEKDKKEFLQDLEHYENQYLVGRRKKPKNIETPGGAVKAIHSLTRMGVTVGSAPNWAFASLAESTQIMAGEIGNTLRGRDMILLDEMGLLSPEARSRVAEQVNLASHDNLTKHNIGRRTGIYYQDDLLEGEDPDTPDTIYKKLDAAERWTRYQAVRGFSAVNVTNRLVGAIKAVRKTKRLISNKENFFNFIEKASQSNDRKEIQKLAREFGLDVDVALQVYWSGVNTPESADMFVKILTDFSDTHGVEWNRVNAYMRELKLAGDDLSAMALLKAGQQVMSTFQYVNTKVNLDPRMLNQQVSKNAVQEMLAALTQFPALAFHNLKTTFMMGGFATLAGWFIPFYFGEALYKTLQDVVRGQSIRTIREKWYKDPIGSNLSVIQNLPFMGSVGRIIQPFLTSLAVDTLRGILSDPDAFKGYQDTMGTSATAGIPGWSMLARGMQNLERGIKKAYAGEWDEASELFTKVAPIPFRQAAVIGIRAAWDLDNVLNTDKKRSGSYSPSSGYPSTLSIRKGSHRSSEGIVGGTGTPLGLGTDVTPPAVPSGPTEYTPPQRGLADPQASTMDSGTSEVTLEESKIPTEGIDNPGVTGDVYEALPDS